MNSLSTTKENRLNRIWKTRNRKVFKLDTDVAATVAKNSKLNGETVLSTISGLVDLNLSNETSMTLDDRKPIVKQSEAPLTSMNGSFFKRAVQEPANKYSEIKSKSKRYETMESRRGKQSNSSTSNSSKSCSSSSERDELSGDDSAGAFKFFNRVFNNLVHTKEFRTSHEVFFDDPSTAVDNNDPELKRSKQRKNELKNNMTNLYEYRDYENDTAKY